MNNKVKDALNIYETIADSLCAVRCVRAEEEMPSGLSIEDKIAINDAMMEMDKVMHRIVNDAYFGSNKVKDKYESIVLRDGIYEVLNTYIVAYLAGKNMSIDDYKDANALVDELDEKSEDYVRYADKRNELEDIMLDIMKSDATYKYYDDCFDKEMGE